MGGRGLDLAGGWGRLTQRSAISVGTKGFFQIKQARKDAPGREHSKCKGPEVGTI